MTGGYSSLLVLALILMEFPPFSSSLRSSTAPPAPLTDEQKNRAISALEFSLLKMFGLSKRPRPSRDIVIPQYMIDLYRQQTNDQTYIPSVFRRGKAVDVGNTVRSFHHEDVLPLHGCSEDNCARIWFNLTNMPSDELLTAAELRIYVARNSSHEPDPDKPVRQTLQVFEIMKPVSKHREPVSRLIDVQDVIVQNSSWVTLDVHPAVLKWKNKPRFNHGLEVRVLANRKTPSSSPSKHVRLRRSTDIAESQWNIERPLLVAYSDDGKSRTRRDVNNTNKKRKRKRNNKKCEKGKKGRKCRRKRKKKNKKGKGKNPPAKRRKGHKNLCRRHPLYVDFNDVGWDDWIVAPLGYEAYYCDGNCPFPLTDNLNTTNHAIVQTLVHSVDSKAAPTACCVPTSLSSISMLYTDEFDKVILKQYDEMIVEGCGCR